MLPLAKPGFGLCLLILAGSCTINRETLTTAADESSKPAAKPAAAAQAQKDAWLFQQVAGSVLKFRDGQEYDTRLLQPAYIGQIANGRQAPYLIFAGRYCNQCDANPGLYIHSPANGTLAVANGQNRYARPGTEHYYADYSPIYRARAFYGQVLDNTKGVIWYQQHRQADNSWRKSVFLVALTPGGQRDTTLADQGQLATTLKLLKQGQCREIEGSDYPSEP
ncbi:hypothetical protein [Hymenobacter sp. B81]|uniref:hypothetical protein n=1 Tax=Hymenobacter sp. B81 TaxID=3344878 RepID=UPI0037DD1E78